MSERSIACVVGLGNPGKRYAGTRHNVGFMVIDLLAKSKDAAPFRERHEAELAELRDDGRVLLLVKPITFMNLSGQAVQRIVHYYDIQPDRLLIVCDDINLPLGKLRFRAKGSHGGHNGLRDIQQHLGTTEYHRLRIGVGAPEQHDAVDYVLGSFTATERPIIQDAIEKAAVGVTCWWFDGIEKAMNEYNG